MLLLLLGVWHQPLRAQSDTTNASQPTGPVQHDIKEAAPATILLQFHADVDEQTRRTVIQSIGGVELHWLPQIYLSIVQIQYQSEPQVQLPELIRLYAGVVQHAELDLEVGGTAYRSAPLAQTASTNYAFDAIKANGAWAITRGETNLIVAILDSGLNLDHPEVQGRIVGGYDFVDDDATPFDGSGHGTHIAGIIGAADDGNGMTGVCPGCSLLPVRVLDDQNTGSWSAVIRGILYAVDHGAAVINLSLGAPHFSHALQAAVEYALQHDVILVAAAGNSDVPTLTFPAAMEGVLAVGAIGPDNHRWAFSNVGSFIDIVAPGQLIYSTHHDVNNRFHGYTYMSGTSTAAPFVSGLLALLKSAYPNQSSEELIRLLIDGVDDLGAPGWDSSYGHGRINATQTMHLPFTSSTAASPRSSHAAQNRHIYLPIITSR